MRNPAGIRQLGHRVPTRGETRAAYFPPTDRSGTIVYALDFAGGIEVLRIDRGDRRVRRAPVRRSWLRQANGSPGTGAITTAPWDGDAIQRLSVPRTPSTAPVHRERFAEHREAFARADARRVAERVASPSAGARSGRPSG